MIYDRIKKICKDKGITVAKLEQDLELGRSSVRKFDQHDPGVGKMNMIAGYLGVTLNDLIDADFDSDKKLLSEMFKAENPDQQKGALDLCKEKGHPHAFKGDGLSESK